MTHIIFLDAPTLKLWIIIIIIIILPTDLSKIILVTARRTKNQVAVALYLV